MASIPLSREFTTAPVYPRRSPITGNISPGMVCSDGQGEALWICLVGDEVQVHATSGGFEDIYTVDDSVTLRSTISTGWDNRGACFALQRIDGELYATFEARKSDSSQAGTWIYRDISVLKDGSGPWTLHGTVASQANPYDIGVANGPTTFDNTVGEIGIFPSGHPNAGRWVMGVGEWYVEGGNIYGHHKKPTLMISDDQGVTWASAGIVYTSGESNLPYGYRTLARNFPWVDGETFWSWNGNVKSGRHFRSNGGTWDHLGAFDTDNSGGYFHVLDDVRTGSLYRVGYTDPAGDTGADTQRRYWQVKSDGNWAALSEGWTDLFLFNQSVSESPDNGLPLLVNYDFIMVLSEASPGYWVGASRGAVQLIGEAPLLDVGVIRNLAINPSGEQDYNKAWAASNGIVDTNVTWEV